jgi:hypothetical protein
MQVPTGVPVAGTRGSARRRPAVPDWAGADLLVTSALNPVSCGGTLARPVPDPEPEPDMSIVNAGGDGTLDAGDAVRVDPIGMSAAAGSAMIVSEEGDYGGGTLRMTRHPRGQWCAR